MVHEHLDRFLGSYDLTADILAPIPHRQVVFTIPRVLRGLFERDRRLLGPLSRSAYETLRRT